MSAALIDPAEFLVGATMTVELSTAMPRTRGAYYFQVRAGVTVDPTELRPVPR